MSRALRLDSLPPGVRLASVALGLAGPPSVATGWRFGVPRLDALALPLAALHEIYPEAEGDGPAAAAVALLLALLATRPGPIVWVQGDAARRDGRLYALGLAELGCDPDRLLLVEAPDTLGVLRAGHDAVACPAIGAVILADPGAARALDLTVTRRLAHAAARSGVPTLLLRQGEARPTAAFSRWRIAAAPSQPLAAGAPGLPSFTFRLDRHRGGAPGFAINLEWDRDRSVLRTPLPGAAPALAARRTRRQERRVA